MAVHSLGEHYYKDDERGYYYDFFDGEFERGDREYFETLEDCKEDIEDIRSCYTQYEELRREGWGW